ncbi:MAG: hypothetical protein ABR955_10065 [Verrucomicrobiota bacterium]
MLRNSIDVFLSRFVPHDPLDLIRFNSRVAALFARLFCERVNGDSTLLRV